MNGCRPIVEYMTFNFCLVGIDQIINAAKMRQMTGGQFNVPIVFVVQQLRQDKDSPQALENWFKHTRS
jgi:pyruvate dehydrogenase E1 component beta subunit